MTTRLCIVRHGETAWNAEHRVQGQLDIPLNNIGLRQAQAVGRALKDERFDAIYSSDLVRARQTAAPIANILSKKLTMKRSLLLVSVQIWRHQKHQLSLQKNTVIFLPV